LSTTQPKSLRDLLLFHQLLFIGLILIATLSGAYGVYAWDKSYKESERINTLVQNIYQVRGDLYRQMKELFDAFLLNDKEALNEYNAYTQNILLQFAHIKEIAKDSEEKKAIEEIRQNYEVFVTEAPPLFFRYQAQPNGANKKIIYKTIETGIFSKYELVSKRAESLLKIKQIELKGQLSIARNTIIFVLCIPILIAGVLMAFSRSFLRASIAKPIESITQATKELSAGNLTYKVPETGALELVELSSQINHMAEELSESRKTIIRTEKQAALGLLVPMLAHNIRNPLASIRATAQVAMAPDLDSDTKESLTGIMQTVDRLERWTTVLLAYLNPIKPQMQAASLNKIINIVSQLLNAKLDEKNITLDSTSITTPIEWTTDEHLIEQMLYNLLLNAIEASPKNSTITLQANQIGHQLNLCIIDQGNGMPFEPNPNAHSPGPSTKRFGTGLGIPFAYKVCDVLNGTLTFSPSTPQGTKIKIAFDCE
jgi:nitrogen fixation/metabolism regulation signal transduction histidine kinase